MVETSFLVSQLTNAALQQGGNQQPLPSPQAKDVGRFEDLMKGQSNATTAIEPQAFDNNDSSVLQLVGPGQEASSTGLVDKMIDHATRMDNSYHSLLEQMGNRPGLDKYLNNQQDAVNDEMMTYPHIDKEAGPKTDPYTALLQRTEDVQSATLEYQSDMNQWAMGFRMWSTGIQVIASAAQKVSQGFQTLFRASG